MPDLSIDQIARALDDRYGMDHQTDHRDRHFWALPGGGDAQPGTLLHRGHTENGFPEVWVFYRGDLLLKIDGDAPLSLAVELVDAVLKHQSADEMGELD